MPRRQISKSQTARTTTKLLPIISLSALLVACGGGGGGGDNTSTGGGGAAAPKTSVTGTASKGIIVGGIVNAYPLVNGVADTSNSLGTATTDENGEYSIELAESYGGGPIIITVEPATDDSTIMRCDVPSGCGSVGFGGDYPLESTTGFSMSAILPEATDGEDVTVNPTPLTQIATQIALNTLADTTTPSDFVILDAITDANSATADRFGITGPLNDQPVVDLTDPVAVAEALADPDVGEDAIIYNALAGAIVEATIDDSSELSIEEAIASFAETYVQNDGIAGNSAIEGATSLDEVLAATLEVITAVGALEGGETLNFGAVTTELNTDLASATGEDADVVDPGTPSTTAADADLDKAKAMVSTLRDIGASVSTELADAADAFSTQIDTAAITSQDETAATFAALTLAAEALVEAAEAFDAGTVTTQYQSSTGVIVTFGLPSSSTAASKTAAATASINQLITAGGFDNAVDLSVVIDYTANETETGEESPDWPQQVTDENGTATLAFDGELDFSLSGSISNSGMELSITDGIITASTDGDGSEIWDHNRDAEGNIDVTEDETLTAMLDLGYQLNITLTQQGAADPVSFAGTVESEIVDLSIDESESWNSSHGGTPAAGGTVDFDDSETWESTVSFTSMNFSLSGTFSTATQSFAATLTIAATGNNVEFSEIGSWTSSWNNQGQYTNDHSNTSSNNETTGNYVALSASLGFEAELTGISDDVSVTFSINRTGLEAATVGLDLAWSGNRIDMDLSANGADDSGSMSISNQDGVQALIAQTSGSEPTGTLSVNGVEFATINDEGIIRYVDETFESL